MKRGSGLKGLLLLDIALKGNQTLKTQLGTKFDVDWVVTASIPERQEIAEGAETNWTPERIAKNNKSSVNAQLGHVGQRTYALSTGTV